MQKKLRDYRNSNRTDHRDHRDRDENLDQAKSTALPPLRLKSCFHWRKRQNRLWIDNPP